MKEYKEYVQKYCVDSIERIYNDIGSITIVIKNNHLTKPKILLKEQHFELVDTINKYIQELIEEIRNIYPNRYDPIFDKIGWIAPPHPNTRMDRILDQHCKNLIQKMYEDISLIRSVIKINHSHNEITEIKKRLFGFFKKKKQKILFKECQAKIIYSILRSTGYLINNTYQKTDHNTL